jgi:hypothetical protein
MHTQVRSSTAERKKNGPRPASTPIPITVTGPDPPRKPPFSILSRPILTALTVALVAASASSSAIAQKAQSDIAAAARAGAVQQCAEDAAAVSRY